MASITPIFNGAYDGHMINSMTNFVVDNLDKYIEEIDISYKPAFDYNVTGFDSSIYLLNSNTNNYVVANVNIMLVGDLPIYIAQQLIQLSKGILGTEMLLSFVDNIATDRTYTGKWSNAVDFVETNALLCGGNMLIKCYDIYDN